MSLEKSSADGIPEGYRLYVEFKCFFHAREGLSIDRAALYIDSYCIKGYSGITFEKLSTRLESVILCVRG